MAIKVNLIKNRHTLSEAEYQKESQYYRWSIIAVVMVVVVTLAVSLWNFVLTYQMDTLEKQITSSNKQMQSLTEASAKQIYLKSRLKLITSFLDERTVSRQALQKVFSIDIPGINITAASFEGDNTLAVQATAQNAQNLSDMAHYFSSDDGFFLQVVSKAVTRLEDGSYQMDLLLTLPKT
jgi:cytoskeletal protein RodZ